MSADHRKILPSAWNDHFGRFSRFAVEYDNFRAVLRNAIGTRRAPASRVLYDRALAIARSQLGEAAFEAACDAGRAMPLEDAVTAAVDNRRIPE